MSLLALSVEASFFFLGRQAPSPLATLVQASCESAPRQILLLNLETHRSTSAALVSLHAAHKKPPVVCLPSHDKFAAQTSMTLTMASFTAAKSLKQAWLLQRPQHHIANEMNHPVTIHAK